MIECKAQLAGYFQLKKCKGDANGKPIPGTEVELTPVFRNLITNGGLDAIYTTGSNYAISGIIQACQVGSGSTAPANTDANLQTYVAGTASASGGGGNVTTTYGYKDMSYTFAQGVATGNLSEVGIASAASAGTLFSRSLILDGSGNPTTITVLADEILTVSYQLRMYWPTADTTATVTISGTVYTITARPQETAKSFYWADYIHAINGSSSIHYYYYIGTGVLSDATADAGTGAKLAYGGCSRADYVSGTYYRDTTLSLSIGNGNGNLQLAVFTSGLGAYQFQFSPTIPKDNTKTLSLTARISWGRYAP